MKLSDLFEINNGIPVTGLKIHREPSPERLPFIRPASTQRRTVSGWVARSQIQAGKIFPPETLFVSTNGEGSHTYTYVSPIEFVPNSDVAALIPRQAMTLVEKLYYARCIVANRYRFSYGRKPKGDRLGNIELPDRADIPDWIDDGDPGMFDGKDSVAVPQALTLDPTSWSAFVLGDLFTHKKGKRLTKANIQHGTYPFIGAIDKNNGVRQMIGNTTYLHPGGTISVTYNGSVGEAFYQPAPFWASDDVNVLYPRFVMTPATALFICTVIRMEKYRFNYGRKWHLERMRETSLMLPATARGDLALEYMDAYIMALPYSSQIEKEAPPLPEGSHDTPQQTLKVTRAARAASAREADLAQKAPATESLGSVL